MRYVYNLFRLLVVLLLAVGVVHSQCSVTLDGVDGLYSADTVYSGTTVTFWLRYTNATDTNMLGILNGFRTYSPDGGAWKSVKIDTVGLSQRQFDMVLSLVYYDTLDHSTPDTIGVGGACMDSGGLPANYDARAVSITLDLSDNRAVGKHICLDSSFFPPAGTWKWVQDSSFVSIYPSWDGPHCFYVMAQPTSVGDPTAQLPTTPQLSQNYPNPFNPSTVIRFTLPRTAPVTLSITDVLGRHVVTLVDKIVESGVHEVVWDGRNGSGNPVASGMYLYRLQSASFTQSRKMILLK
jgi:hypothetical protein